MGMPYQFAPSAPISASTKKRVAQEVRRIALRLGVDQPGVRRAIHHAQNYLTLTADAMEAITVGVRHAIAEERRMQELPRSWPRIWADVGRSLLERAVGILVWAGLGVSVCGLVLSLARKFGWFA